MKKVHTKMWQVDWGAENSLVIIAPNISAAIAKAQANYETKEEITKAEMLAEADVE